MNHLKTSSLWCGHTCRSNGGDVAFKPYSFRSILKALRDSRNSATYFSQKKKILLLSGHQCNLPRRTFKTERLNDVSEFMKTDWNAVRLFKLAKSLYIVYFSNNVFISLFCGINIRSILGSVLLSSTTRVMFLTGKIRAILLWCCLWRWCASVEGNPTMQNSYISTNWHPSCKNHSWYMLRLPNWSKFSQQAGCEISRWSCCDYVWVNGKMRTFIV